MHDETRTVREPDRDINDARVPVVVDRATFQAELDALREPDAVGEQAIVARRVGIRGRERGRRDRDADVDPVE